MGGPIKSPWEIINRAVVGVPGANDKLLFAPIPGIPFLTQAKATLVSSLNTSGALSPCGLLGINAGAKIANALGMVAPTGGIVDARCFLGDQDITQNMFAGLVYGQPVTLLLSYANFRTTVTQEITRMTNLTIIGETQAGEFVINAGNGTRFTWNGPNGGTVFFYNYTSDSQLSQIQIVPGTGTIAIGIRVDQTVVAPPGVSLSAKNLFDTITVVGATTGMQIGNESTFQNDTHTFSSVAVVGPGTNGYFINNGESKDIKIFGGRIISCTNGVNDVLGSFHADSINLSGNTNDFLLDGPFDQCSIVRCYSESANKFLAAAAGVQNYGTPVTLWANRAIPNNVGVDNIYLQFHMTGPLIMMGNTFESGPLPGVKCDFQALGGPQVVSIGNLWWDAYAYFGMLNDDQPNIVSLGDQAINAAFAYENMPTLIGDTSSLPSWTVLANGANNDVPTVQIVAGQYHAFNFLKISGPTAAFDISGFSAGRGGRQLMVYNTTAQQMTIKNLGASFAGNQILTLTGADVVLRVGTSFAEFVYDGVGPLAPPRIGGPGNWILRNTN